MALPRGNLHHLELSGQGTINSIGEDLAWRRTGIEFDSERPRGILIEEVELFHEGGAILAVDSRAIVTPHLAISTGHVTRTATAPRNRMLLGSKMFVFLRNVNVGIVGAEGGLVTGNSLPQLRGTVWVAPWIGLVQDSGATFSNLSRTSLHMIYRVVDLEFDLAHALFDQADEAIDLDHDWWNL